MFIQKESLRVGLILFLFVSCLLLTGFSDAFENTDKNDELTMKAIVRSDNDFATYNDKDSLRENIPEIVANKIRYLLKECRTDFYRYDKSSECDYIVFRVKYTKYISVYVSKIYYQHSVRYYLVAYDSKTSRITNKPPHINGDAMENDEEGFLPEARLLEKPLISFSPFDSNNCKGTVIIKQRMHNGTGYNAVIDEYYSIDAYMDLNAFLYIESKAVVYGNGRCIVNRSLKDDVIVSTIKCEDDEQPKLMGKVRLEISENNVRIISIEVSDKMFENSPYLVTASGVKKETFLNKGLW